MIQLKIKCLGGPNDGKEIISNVKDFDAITETLTLEHSHYTLREFRCLTDNGYIITYFYVWDNSVVENYHPVMMDFVS